MSETQIWFGKHNGKEIKHVPGGYLRWLVTVDPRPMNVDAEGKTPEEIKAMTERMRNLLSEVEDELAEREAAKERELDQ